MTAADHVAELIPGYLAGVLEPDERRTVEEHAAACAACSRLFDELREPGEALVASSLDLGTGLGAILAQIDADERAPAARPARSTVAPLRPPRRRIGAGVAIAAAAAVAALAFGIGRATAPGGAPTDGARLTDLSALTGERGSGRASLASDRGARYVRLRLSDLPQVTADGFYEAWLGRDDGSMIALGTFRPHADGSADLLLPLPVDADTFDFLDVSAEADDGDPGHSARSVVRGPIRHA